MEHFSYLVAAYTVVWVFIAGYVFYIGSKQGKLEDELQNIKENKDKI